MKLNVVVLTLLAVGVALTDGVRKSRSNSRSAHRRRDDISSCISDSRRRRSSGNIDDRHKCREGWGKGTKGGSDGDLYEVKTLSDFDSCDLRGALESTEKLYIVFDVKGRIKLDETIKIESYKTIDGSEGKGAGQMIIEAPPKTQNTDKDGKTCYHSTALEMKGGKELVISHIHLDGALSSSKWDADAECADAIYIEESEDIWIHHNKFTRWQDSAIEVREKNGNLNDKVTITDNLIEEVYQAFVVSAHELSFGRNYCKKVRKRCIKVYEGRAHSYNNLIEDWTDRSIQNAVKGELYSESNVFTWDRRRRGSFDDKVNKIESSKGGIYNDNNMEDGGTINYCDENNSCNPNNDGQVGKQSVNGSIRKDAEYICTGASNSCRTNIINQAKNAGPG